jgi:YidC/Oxa1 family membrane protein insertase
LLLSFLGFMMYVEWQSQFAPDAPAPVEPLPGQQASADIPGDIPSAADVPSGLETSPDDVPDLPEPVEGAPLAGSTPVAASGEARSGTRIEVVTDLLVAEIDPIGGTLVGLRLRDYPVSVDQPDVPFVLLNENMAGYHVAQTGLVDTDGRAPNHTSRFDFDRTAYEMAPDQDRLTVPLRWQGDNGLAIEQRWTFHRDDYVIEHVVEITNNGAEAWQGSRYLQLQKSPEQGSNGMSFTNPERISFNGAAVFDPQEKFIKLPFDEFAEEPYRNTLEGGWSGMVQHYFLSAWIPTAEMPHRYTTRLVDSVVPNRFALSSTSTPIRVEPGTTQRFEARLFAGPKQQQRLDEVAPGLGLTVDYGIFTVFSKPLFWLLDKIHALVNNWGAAIILLTLLIKLAFFKLTQAQFRSMGKMRKLQPRIQQLKERYGDDRQKFGQAMMDIYKKEKVNPLGGCLPVLVQIPIFIALYWVLLESVELRQASFLWVSDLSKPDPLFILPVINGLFMIVTQRLTPMAGMDPMQRKIMQWLPVTFAVLFAFFPAGLVLYWSANSGISLLQQWFILRQIDAEDARARA